MISVVNFEKTVNRLSEASVTSKKMDKQFALFLNEENIIRDLEVAAVQYEKAFNSLLPAEKLPPPPFRFQFTLDLSKIKKRSAKLYDLFVKEPYLGLNLVKNVIFCTVILVVSSAPLEKTDIHIVPLVVNLPISNEVSSLLRFPSYGLETMQGMLLSKTTAAKYVRSSIWSCESMSCRRNKCQRYTGSIPTVCPDCCGPMREHVASTDAGEEISCQFLSLRAYQSIGRFQALNAKIKDELCNTVDLEVGEEYVITGRLNERTFEIMNLKPIYFNTGNYSDVPESIASYYFEISQVEPDCPWSFVVAVSSLLGSFLIPKSSFLNLKLGLMLSLATMRAEVPVPVLAVGSDTLNTQILFRAAGKFAERYIKYSVPNSFLGGIIKPKFQADVICQEAGQFIVATKGICDLGDWSKYKREQASYICQTVESGKILFNKGEYGKPNLTSFVPLKCAVWTYWRDLGKRRNRSPQLKTLINVFGIPLLAEETNEIEHDKICWRNISTAMNDFDESSARNYEKIPTADFKEFFKVINSREVFLSDAASQLIRSYFVVSRRDKLQCLPLGAITTMYTSLAEAHARLALRNEVLPEDVVMVVFLYEEVMSSFYGESRIPYPKVPNDNEPVHVWMSRQLREFSIWLEEYVAI